MNTPSFDLRDRVLRCGGTKPDKMRASELATNKKVQKRPNEPQNPLDLFRDRLRNPSKLGLEHISDLFRRFQKADCISASVERLQPSLSMKAYDVLSTNDTTR
jgi:hypothetical protein